ncbi:MAG TPA: hypothetical protein IAB43_07060 [Candidatus Spyradocola merdavium]|nr:hypothetical protein [Candidatus Spyradocola merdavium]
MLILLAASLFFSSLSIARFALRRHFSQPKKKAAQPHGCAAARTTRRIPESAPSARFLAAYTPPLRIQ